MVIQCFRIALQLPANNGFTITIFEHSSDKIFLSSQLVMRVFIPLFSTKSYSCSFSVSKGLLGSLTDKVTFNFSG